MKKIEVKNFGPIKNANVDFGDMTILIGTQASGKSLFLQLVKLLLDKQHIISTMDRYNYVVGKRPENILNFYFGEGLASIWRQNTKICDEEQEYTKNSLIPIISYIDPDETLFYIPAQRVVSISDGRPKNFMEYDISTPYVLRQFSEQLRLFFQYGLNGSNIVFPLQNRLKGAMKKSLQDNIFHQGSVLIDESSGQKKMKLSVNGLSIPFMAWSAGQKEFMPLLMAFYCLSGPVSNVIDRDQYKYVVLEEPEMGLHPKAILSILLEIIELMQNGKKIILSTHSPVLLEFAWAFNNIKNCKASKKQKEKMLMQLLDVEHFEAISQMMDGVFEKSIRTYYFANKNGGVETMDISHLDVMSDNSDMADWGGLAQFSEKASQIVSSVINEDYD